MHSSIATLLLLLAASVAGADAECDAVEKHSLGNIECTRDEFGYTLEYSNFIARRIALASARYDEMIAALCAAGGGTVRETWYKPWEGRQLRTIHCSE